ncbi:MAG TPA: 3'-5' exonuclease [Mobilitalea sp.]|nr:3'-5' exonuclease [Mobilitalea sp.]
MKYIVIDLEFNQDPDSLINSEIDNSVSDSNNPSPKIRYPYEIIQIGAVKLDENLRPEGTFNRYVKPTIYGSITPHITELTGITLERLQSETTFGKVYDEFTEFIEDKENILCVWGIIDIKTLYKNIKYHNLDESLLPKKYINIQPYTSVYLGQSKKRLLNLKFCAEALGIEINSTFHDALHDAMYTAEIFRKIFHSSIKPDLYIPAKEKPEGEKPERQPRKVLNFSKLIAQFEKMFKREMTKEEKEIIRLAYHMGKTGQFLETDNNLCNSDD